MSHFCAFGLEIARIVRVGLSFDWKLFDNVKTVTFQSNDLFRVVGQEADLTNTEIDQYLRAGAVFPEIHWKPELFVCLDGVQALFLELIGTNFCRQSDSPSFLAHINEDAGAFFADVL